MIDIIMREHENIQITGMALVLCFPDNNQILQSHDLEKNILCFFKLSRNVKSCSIYLILPKKNHYAEV